MKTGDPQGSVGSNPTLSGTSNLGNSAVFTEKSGVSWYSPRACCGRYVAARSNPNGNRLSSSASTSWSTSDSDRRLRLCRKRRAAVRPGRPSRRRGGAGQVGQPSRSPGQRAVKRSGVGGQRQRRRRVPREALEHLRRDASRREPTQARPAQGVEVADRARLIGVAKEARTLTLGSLSRVAWFGEPRRSRRVQVGTEHRRDILTNRHPREDPRSRREQPHEFGKLARRLGPQRQFGVGAVLGGVAWEPDGGRVVVQPQIHARQRPKLVRAQRRFEREPVEPESRLARHARARWSASRRFEQRRCLARLQRTPHELSKPERYALLREHRQRIRADATDAHEPVEERLARCDVVIHGLDGDAGVTLCSEPGRSLVECHVGQVDRSHAVEHQPDTRPHKLDVSFRCRSSVLLRRCLPGPQRLGIIVEQRCERPGRFRRPPVKQPPPGELRPDVGRQLLQPSRQRRVGLLPCRPLRRQRFELAAEFFGSALVGERHEPPPHVTRPELDGPACGLLDLAVRVAVRVSVCRCHRQRPLRSEPRRIKRTSNPSAFASRSRESTVIPRSDRISRDNALGSTPDAAAISASVRPSRRMASRSRLCVSTSEVCQRFLCVSNVTCNFLFQRAELVARRARRLALLNQHKLA